MFLLQILIVLLLIYIVFSFGPSVFMFREVFLKCRKNIRTEMRYYHLPFADKIEEAKKSLLAVETREVTVTARDGTILKADVLDGGYDKTAILIHGFHADPLSNCAVQADALYKQGYNIYLIHLRCHGKSGGRYVTMGLEEQYDVLRFIEAAATENVRHIVLYGVSLGASSIAFASDKITEPKVSALVLDCGFSSFYEQLKEDCKGMHIPPWAVLPNISLFYRLYFKGSIKASAVDSLKNNHIPTAVVHGMGDNSVLFSHGEKMYADCASEKEAIFVADAEHTCALLQDEEALCRMLSFLDRHTKS